MMISLIEFCFLFFLHLLLWLLPAMKLLYFDWLSFAFTFQCIKVFKT